MVGDFEDQARAAIRDAMTAVNMTQAELARRVGITEKHTSQVLTGRVRLSFALAEEMLRACGRRPVVRTRRVVGRVAERQRGGAA